MQTLIIKVPNSKLKDVAVYVENIGGEVVQTKFKANSEHDEDNEVTHEVFFGENIKRLIKAFKN